MPMVLRSGQDDDRDAVERRFLRQFGEYFDAVHMGQMNVEQDQVGGGRIGKGGLVPQVAEHGFAAFDDVQMMGDIGVVKGAAGEHDVAVVVFHQQDMQGLTAFDLGAHGVGELQRGADEFAVVCEGSGRHNLPPRFVLFQRLAASDDIGYGMLQRFAVFTAFYQIAPCAAKQGFLLGSFTFRSAIDENRNIGHLCVQRGDRGDAIHVEQVEIEQDGVEYFFVDALEGVKQAWDAGDIDRGIPGFVQHTLQQEYVALAIFHDQ